MNRIFALVTLLVFVSGCQSVGPNTAGGGAFGGLTGGLAGAAIGATEGKAPEGALIGAVAGTTVGAIAGGAVDRNIEQQRFADQQFRNQQIANSITLDQVVRMTQSGLGSDVISRQVVSQGIAARPTIDDLIFLKQNGVDDQIINAIQNAPLAGQGQGFPVQYVETAPVVIAAQPHFGPRRYHRGRRYPKRHRRPGVNLAFGF